MRERLKAVKLLTGQMKGTAFAGALFFLVAAGLRVASASDVPATIEPPPGWTDITAKKDVRGVVLALSGPEASTFVVARMPESAASSAAALRAYLAHALDEIRLGARTDYRSNGRIETKSFRNGVTARFLRAEAAGRPTLLVAALDAGGAPVLATLSSAAPEAMMSPLFGALRMGPESGEVHDQGIAVSLDGQFEIALGGGLRSRDLTPREKNKGVVLAMQGFGSEVLFLKVEAEDASPKGRADAVRAATANAATARLDSVSPARRAPTAAGPAAAYAWTKASDPDDARIATGFLPWAYWGYAVLGRGSQADELMAGVLAALREGPRAVSKLVAASPRLDIPERGLPRSLLIAVASGAGALTLVLWAWSRRLKNAESDRAAGETARRRRN